MKTLETTAHDSSTIISLDDAKKYLRVDGAEEDNLISAMIAAAVAYTENYLNQTVGVNSYVMHMDSFEPEIFVMRPPLTTLTSISYVDTEGAEQTIDLADVKFNKTQGVIYPKKGFSFPQTAEEPFSVSIAYTSNGMLAAKSADDIINAIKMIIGFEYDYRDDPAQRWKKASDRVLAPLRIIPFG